MVSCNIEKSPLSPSPRSSSLVITWLLNVFLITSVDIDNGLLSGIVLLIK